MNEQASTAGIRDIAPPVDVFPYPPWMIISAVVLATCLIAGAVYLVRQWWRSRPPPPSASARSVALEQLRVLAGEAPQLDPYAFSIRVSDVLRSYVTAHYGFRATRQTSQEFLAAAAGTPGFSPGEETLLAAFLEKCDLIKFARVEVSRAENTWLVDQATRFVEGRAA